MKEYKNIRESVFYMKSVEKIALGLFLLLFVCSSQTAFSETVDIEKCQKQVEKCTAVIDKNPNNFSSYHKRAEAEYSLGMYKEAVQDYSVVDRKSVV